MTELIELFEARYIYLFVLVLLAIGLYGILMKADLLKKVIGLTIFSTAIYLFFIEGSVQEGGTTPVITDGVTDPSAYVDPLPHLLILTAIVVGVGVTGVALALLVRLYRAHGTLDENVIAAQLAGRAAETQTADTQGAETGSADARAEGPDQSGSGQ